MKKLHFPVEVKGEKKFNKYQDSLCLNVTAKEKRKAQVEILGSQPLSELAAANMKEIGRCKRAEFIKSFITAQAEQGRALTKRG